MISANSSTFENILFQGTTNQNNLIQGNYIGTDATGNAPLGSTPFAIGIIAASGTVIGGTVPGARNVLSNAQEAIELDNATSNGNFILGNYVGTNAAGNAAIPNTDHGVLLLGSSNNFVGGEDFGAGNLISGNLGSGILIGGFTNVVQGNLIGTDASGTVAIPNQGGILEGGVQTLIGGTSSAARNVISGNSGSGIEMAGQGGLILGNFIGTTASGSSALGNSDVGVFGRGSGRIGGRLPGEGNIIAYNGDRGIIVFGAGNTTPVVGNSIFNNQQIGIDLNADGFSPNDDGDADAGANLTQNFPALDQVLESGGETVISGTLNSTANSTFAIDLYSSPTCDPSGNGQGKNYLGSTSVTTDGSGNGTFSANLSAAPIPGYVFAATATDAAGTYLGVFCVHLFCSAVEPGKQLARLQRADAAVIREYNSRRHLLVVGTERFSIVHSEPDPSQRDGCSFGSVSCQRQHSELLINFKRYRRCCESNTGTLPAFLAGCNIRSPIQPVLFSDWRKRSVCVCGNGWITAAGTYLESGRTAIGYLVRYGNL